MITFIYEWFPVFYPSIMVVLIFLFLVFGIKRN